VFSYHVKATNIAAKVLIGDNEWVCSAPVPFGISKEDVEGRGLLKESPEIDCYDAKTKVKTKTSVRRVSLGNKPFFLPMTGIGFLKYQMMMCLKLFLILKMG
jgi:hypothetical protein